LLIKEIIKDEEEFKHMLSYSEIMKRYYAKNNENVFLAQKESFQGKESYDLQFPVTLIYDYIKSIYELFDKSKENEKTITVLTSV
jgi:hypothetical protein